MDDLRLVLLIIGCVFVLGIYFWEVFFKAEPRRKDSMLDAVDELPDLPVFETKQADNQYDYSESLADIGSLISNTRDETPSIQDTPAIRQEPAEPAEPEFSSGMSVQDYESKFTEDDFNVFAAVQDDLKQHEFESQDLLTKEVNTAEAEEVDNDEPESEDGNDAARLDENQELGKAIVDVLQEAHRGNPYRLVSLVGEHVSHCVE